MEEILICSFELLHWNSPQIQIKSVLREGDLVIVEKIVATDLESLIPECEVIFDTTTTAFPTSEIDSTTDDYSSSTSEEPFSSTTDETLPSESTTDPAESSSSTTDESESTTDEEFKSSTIETSPSSPVTDDPEPSTSPSPPTPTIETSSQGQPPPLEELEDNSKEIMWMSIAIVFMSLFGLITLFTIYLHYTGKHKLKLPNFTQKSPSAPPQPPTQIAVIGKVAPAVSISKLPRLYVDRLKEKPLITSHQKRV